MKKINFQLALLFFLILVLTACSGTVATPTVAVSATSTLASATNVLSSINTTTSTFIPAPTPTDFPTPTLLPSPTPVPAKVIVIDPGHGGVDWGTFHTNSAGKIDLKEKDITLQLAFQTADLLRAAGYKVILTRTTDELANNPAKDLNGDGRINDLDDQQARVNVAEENKADLFLSLHLNGADNTGISGTETWYCKDRPFGEQNKRFAEIIQQNSLATLKSLGYDSNDRGAQDDIDENGDHIFVLSPPNRNHSSVTEMPGALAEALFISNDAEAALMLKPKTITALAASYAKSVEDYFK